MKREAIRLKGGKCADCGWNGNIAAFQFHHRTPSEKKFTISSNPKVSWEKYWEEIEKCDLLCANCHMIRHSDNADPQFLKDVENYKGRELVVSVIPWKNQTHIPHSYDHNCQYCNKPFTSSRQVQKYCCPNCQSKGRRKCIRPSREELEKMIIEMPMTHIGKKYGVSSVAVKKWCKNYEI